MSSKNDILSAIRRHTGKRYDMPELTLDAITYEDKILQFTDSLKAAGGQVVLMQPGDDINDIIRHHFPDAIRIASNLSSITCATFNPDDLDDPRELDNTDLAIVEGHFGVAENGAVWITRQVKHKALYFNTTNTLTGPCAPNTRACSISAVLEGPEIKAPKSYVMFSVRL